MVKVTTTTAAVLVAAAIAAPGAGAMPIDPQPTGVDRGGVGASTDPISAVEPAPSGFDWGDAGLGAAGMLSVLGLGSGAVLIARRGRRGHAATG
jgi:hypothetical protein